MWIELPEGPLQEVDLGDGVQLTSQLVYGPPYMPVLGIRLDFPHDVSLAFSADTRFYDYQFASLARNCDLLIHDAFVSSAVQHQASSAEMVFHSTVSQAAQVAAYANAKRLALMHRSLEKTYRQKLEDEAREHFKGTILVPDDGFCIRLDAIQ